ncbi:hypothetical protein OBBRIDRAFT_457557 [Obba rivulosa]|uniref:Uncharacterized protein n=1 Tax=Obba rivulosa TaxID=1052685 RepID=A0A8E2DN93_9APHY|nr:hypothetical protein OBBRIDRAFT_457557 [Obba rivulosa]
MARSEKFPAVDQIASYSKRSSGNTAKVSKLAVMRVEVAVSNAAEDGIAGAKGALGCQRRLTLLGIRNEYTTGVAQLQVWQAYCGKNHFARRSAKIAKKCATFVEIGKNLRYPKCYD